jgi:hypothetical protein
MKTKFQLILAALVVSTLAYSQSLPVGPGPVVPEADGVFQVHPISNLNIGDSVVNLTNTGTLSGFDPAGRICVNAYVFSPDEQLVACCSCPVTPNALNSLSAKNDLVSNTLTPGVPTSIVVKLLASVPAGGSCNPSSPNASNLVRGMRAWATSLHALPTTPVTYFGSESEFSKAELSATELAKLTGFCAFIQANGSGFGICKSCRLGGLGAVSQ